MNLATPRRATATASICGGSTGSTLRNMLLVSRVVAEAALARTETRGAHQREDYPGLSPDWALNQTAALRDRRIEISGGPRSIAEAML